MMPDHLQAIRDGELALNAALRDTITTAMRNAEQRFVERELLWSRQSSHGRWVVISASVTRLFRRGEFAKRQRDMIEEITLPQRRGRRFSSLSRARRFARRVGGTVRRWRAHEWRSVSPWESALRGL